MRVRLLTDKTKENIIINIQHLHLAISVLSFIHYMTKVLLFIEAFDFMEIINS